MRSQVEKETTLLFRMDDLTTYLIRKAGMHERGAPASSRFGRATGKENSIPEPCGEPSSRVLPAWWEISCVLMLTDRVHVRMGDV